MKVEKNAEKFMELMEKIETAPLQKKITESMHGENLVLHYLDKKKSIVPGEICKLQHVSSARIAATLNSLEKKGLITREIDPQDRRRVIVHLSEKGTIVAKERRAEILTKFHNVLEYLGDEEAEMFIKIMTKLVSEDSPFWK